MNIDHEFTVPAPAARAWELLTDLEQVAPCMPGAQLTGVDGDTYLGTVKVKVGPVSTTYRGTASFVEKDDDAYHAVIAATGKEARGSGTAAATIDMRLRPEGDDRTVVTVGTDLKISGKIAQFGSGMIEEVSTKLLGQFTDCLGGRIADGGNAEADGAGTADAEDAPAEPSPAPASAAAASPVTEAASPPATPAPAATPLRSANASPAAASASGTTTAPQRTFEPVAGPEPAALDLVGVVGPALLKRLAPVIAGLVVLVLVLRWLRR